MFMKQPSTKSSALDDKRKEYVMKAFKTALTNSYLRCLFGNDQLFYLFMEGFKFAKTDKIPEDLFDNEEFITNPEKFNYKSNEKNDG